MRDINEWCKESICKGESDKTFFTGVGQNPTRAREKLCNSCPVAQDCLDYAIIYEERGVWGGTTEKERKRLRYLRPSLIAEAKRLGIFESRPSVDQMIQEDRQKKLQIERELSLDKQLLQEEEPPEGLLMAAPSPIVGAA
jgi:WhiB family transcriptional regulator, redox-sensing transcriptional regulator